MLFLPKENEKFASSSRMNLFDCIGVLIIAFTLCFYSAIPSTVQFKFVLLLPGGIYMFWTDLPLVFWLVIQLSRKIQNSKGDFLIVSLSLVIIIVGMLVWPNKALAISNSVDTLILIFSVLLLQQNLWGKNFTVYILVGLLLLISAQVIYFGLLGGQYFSDYTGRVIGGGFTRSRTTVGAATGTGVFIFLIIGILIRLRGRFYIGILGYFAIFLGVLSMFVLFSRGPILMMLLSICLLSLIAFVKRGQFIQSLFIIIIAIAPGGVLFFNEGFKEFVFYRMQAAIKSDEARFIRFLEGLDACLIEPIFGVGPGVWQHLEKFKGFEMSSFAESFSPHNFYIIIAIHYGIPFALVFFSLFLKRFALTVRRRDWELVALLLPLFTVGFNTEIVYASLPYGLLLAMLINSKKDHPRFDKFN